ncbi:MAG: MFS transporter [Betaproteobacteria bacterium]|nr:MFS transporter [Betaproteobacteria bacterium]
MKNHVISERLLVVILASVQFTHIMDFMVLMPLGPQLMRVLHIGAREFGFLVAAYTLSAALSALLTAFYIDRFDRKRALLFLYAGFVVSTLLCGFAAGYGTLLAARIVAGAFGGVAGAVVHAILGDAIPQERRGAATGAVMSAFSIAAVAGVPTGLFLANQFQWRAPFLFLAAVSSLVLFGVWRTVPQMRAHMREGRSATKALQQMRTVFADANHRRALALPAMLVFGGFSVIPFLSPYAVSNVGIKESDLPYIYFFGGLATAFTSRFIGRLSDRHGKREVFAVVAILSLIPLVTVTNLPPVPLWLMLCSSTLFFIFVSGRFVPAMALVNASAQPSMRGSLMSFNTALQHFSSGLASLCGGFIVCHTDTGALTRYWVVGLIAVACTLAGIRIAWGIRPVS